ncbi:hypothetical protein [Sphingomonas asaccharolytica]|uniref:hypothetical protein n=1 Tax=Sphingomonas asaccharolytica TaxID=40681 RepID=UPI000836EADA|nr:hypothetical protein [Sphingomonas asaccharolytica]
MNQAQLKYARARAERVFRDRKDAIVAKHTTPAVRLSTGEQLDALRAGAFKIDKKAGQLRYGWEYGVTFTAERDQKVNQPEIDRETAELTEAYRKLEDELVLGDNEQALVLLRAFEGAAEA